MLLRWVNSEVALCPMRDYLESYDKQYENSKKMINTHLSRPHILLSSLPTPSEALEISLPPNVRSKTAHLHIQNIANLWMQLLSIQVQNGGFIRHDKWSKIKRTRICISQLTEAECAGIYQSFRKTNPPVDEAVADLICSLPYASCNDECYKIAPSTMMPNPTSERELYSGGPIIPPHLMRLTNWWGGDSGMLILIDISNGEATELKDYKSDHDNGDPHGNVMTEYTGPRKPIEELLQEWISNYLKMRWIPDGSMDIAQVEWRNMVRAIFTNLIFPFIYHLASPFGIRLTIL
jgi:hypothetical protein